MKTASSTDEWINVVFTYNGILFSHKEKRNLVIAGKWIELEIIILSEVSQVQKTKSHMFSLKYRPNTNTAIS
jgi:hypothetical protein